MCVLIGELVAFFGSQVKYVLRLRLGIFAVNEQDHSSKSTKKEEKRQTLI